jgi:protein gp37
MRVTPQVALDALTLDDAIQPRVAMAPDLVRTYAALYADGNDLGPIMVYQEGDTYWLADGFHRVRAAREAGLTALPATLQHGTRRDAMIYACSANKHGMPMSHADKRRAILRLLEDEEWGEKKDREIGRHCGVSHTTVAKYRRDIGGQIGQVKNNPHSTPTQDSPASPPVPTPSAPSVPAPRSCPTVPLVLTPERPVIKNPPTFNQTNEMVDWARWTWNPVTGCLHTCVYCYARDIANRYYPQKFAPTFRPERLAAPHYTKVPARAETEPGWRNVFVCSMADLFGKWVPQAWIDAVLAEVRAAPQWNFLFLTKFPQRLETIQWPANAWVGTTVDEQYRVDIAEKAFRNVEAPVKWLSCEPLRERLTFTSLAMFDWVVLGGQSASSQAPAMQPQWAWVEHLLLQARSAGCLVYWKPNLLTRPQEYPGESEAEP